MRRAALPLALALLLASLALPAMASPQPTPVCGPCGAGLEEAASEPTAVQGLQVTESRAVVSVHEDGTATWRVRSRVSNETAVDYLREHPEALDRIARNAIEYSTAEGPFRNVTATLDGNTVTVRYEDAEAAREFGGVLVVDYLHSRGHDTWPVLTADRLTIVGPEGTTVTNDPPGARVEGRNATWSGNATVRVHEAPTVEQDAYVAYAEGGPVSQVLTTLAIAAATAPIVFDVTFGILVPPLLLFALALGGVALLARRATSRPPLGDPRTVGTAVALLGALVLVASLPGIEDVLPVASHRMAGGAGGVALAMGAVARWRGADTRTRDLVAAGALALAGFVAVLALALPNEYVSGSQALRVGAREGARVLPFVVLPLLGAALSAGRRRILRAGSVVVAAFLLAELSTVWPTQRPFGLVVVFFAGYALAVAAAGFPLLLLGATTRREGG